MLVAFIQSDFHEDHIIYIKSLTANRKLLKANPPLMSVTGDPHSIQCGVPEIDVQRALDDQQGSNCYQKNIKKILSPTVFKLHLPYIILNSALVIWNHKFLANCFRLENIIFQRNPVSTNLFELTNISSSVLKSFVTTSYALDSTLHAICYHHVENQRGSLVKQHCLSTHDFACSFRRQYY
uniref:SFRICE_024583 n=1 Tax=Spodoptera frugiperda TaxID=7108 RepID=A0A2H1V3N6_SPOFR